MDGYGGYHLKWCNPITKEHTWYALNDKLILTQKLRIPKIQFAKHMKLKDTLVPLRSGKKIPMEGVTETKFGAETKGLTIQRLPHLGIHPIINHQKQTTLHTLARFCWKAMQVPGKHRSEYSQSAIGSNTGPSLEELEKGTTTLLKDN